MVSLYNLFVEYALGYVC